MSEYVMMPKEDYVSICDYIREKLGITDLIKSNEIVDLIKSIGDSGTISIQEINSATEMTKLLASENIGSVYKYVGETTEKYINGDIYVVEENI